MPDFFLTPAREHRIVNEIYYLYPSRNARQMHLEFIHLHAYGKRHIIAVERDVTQIFHQNGVDATVEETAYKEKQAGLHGVCHLGCRWVKFRYLSAS